MRAPTYTRQEGIPIGGQAPRVDVEDAGAGAKVAARGLQIASEAAADYAHQLVAAKRAIEFQKANNAATRELDDLTLALEQEGDWKNGAKRFEDGFNEIKKKHGEALSDSYTRAQFEGTLGRNFETKRVSLQRKLVDFMQADGEATVVEQMDAGARAAAGARSDLERDQIVSGVASSIATMRDARIISPIKAVQMHREFKSKVDEARVLRDLNVGGERGIGAVVERLQAGDYGNLDPVRRERLINTAQQRLDIEVRRGIAASERSERNADRQLKRVQDMNTVFLLEKIDADPNSVDDAQLREFVRTQRLDGASYRMLVDRRQGGQEGRDNPHVLNDLQTRMIRNGEDVHDAIVAARNNKQLSARMTGELMSENARRRTTSDKEEWKTAEERDEFAFLERSLGKDKLQFAFDDDTAQRVALAGREYRQRVRAGEKPRDVANDIVARTQRAPVALPSTYYDQPKSKADIATAIGRLRTLRENGTLSPQIYEREMLKLRDLEPTLAEPPAPAKRGGAAVQQPQRAK